MTLTMSGPKQEELLRRALAGEQDALLEVAALCAAALIKRALAGDKEAERLLDRKLPGWREAYLEQRPLC